MKKAAAILISVLALTAAVAVAGPVEKAQAASNCNATQACYWDGFNFTGTGPKVMTKCIRSFGYYGFDNKASSVYNNGTQDHLYVYLGNNATGTRGVVLRGQGGNLSAVFNNTISSAYFASYDKATYWKSTTCI
ncbi:MAG: peptidase inhibitor family I36 protein [Bifidobacteriaceae bacterium]|nr:peptidase inhibitor family I36 protein [Bifidobacteriaceae bacterium]